MNLIRIYSMVAVAVLASVAATASAATLNWIAPGNVADPSWQNLANWRQGRLPGQGDDVRATNAATPVIGAAAARARSLDFSKTGVRITARSLTLGSETAATTSFVDGTLTVQGGALNLLNGASLEVDMLAWSGGRLDGAGKSLIKVNDTAILSGAAVKTLRNQEPLGKVNDITLSFQKAAVWVGAGNLSLGTGAVLEISRLSQFDDSGGHRIKLQGGNFDALVRNEGVYLMDGGRTVSEVRFRNLGTIKIANGTELALANGLYQSFTTPKTDSSYDPSSQTLREGNYEIAGTGVLGINLYTTGPDSIRNGIETIGADASVRLTDVARTANPIRNITSGGQGSRDALQSLTSIAGSLQLSGRTEFRPGGDLANSGRLTVDEGATLSLRALGRVESTGKLINNGIVSARFVTATGAAATLDVGSKGKLTAAGGLDILNGATASNAGLVVAPVRVDGGPAGLVETRFVVDAGGVVDGGVDVRRKGKLSLNGGTVKGVVRLRGSSRLNGHGLIDGNLVGTVVGGLTPTISIGDDLAKTEAKLSVTGDFRNVGALFVSVDGREAGVSHDLIDVGGTAFLGGNLYVTFESTFRVVAGDYFKVLTAPNNDIVGNFNSVTPIGLAPGLQMRTEVTPHWVALAFSNAAPVPEPGTWAMLALGLGALSLRLRRRDR